MSALSNNLLEFILGLLSNEQELKKFDSNKADYMRDAGYGGCEGEVDDYRRMVDDYKPASHGHAKADTGNHQHGHTDYQAVKHVTEHKHVVDHKHDHDHHPVAPVVNHHYGPTSHNENNMYGDTYKVWAEDSTVALPGGVAIGEDAYLKNVSIDAQANRVQNSGDGAQVAGDDARAEDDAFQNSGNDVGGNFIAEAGDGDLDGDVNAASQGSTANSGTIDNSTQGDTVTKIDVDANVVVGDNNDTQQQSDDAEMENEGFIVVDNPDLNLGGPRVIDELPLS